PQVARQRRRADEARLAVEPQPTVLHRRAADERAVQVADTVAQVALERPARHRRRQLRTLIHRGTHLRPALRLNGGDLPFESADLLLRLAGNLRSFALLGRRQEGTVAGEDAFEGGLEAVVVALQDRIELVVVAAGAVDR